MLLLQEFDFQIQHRPGVQHVVADYLSRLESGEPTETAVVKKTVHKKNWSTKAREPVLHTHARQEAYEDPR